MAVSNSDAWNFCYVLPTKTSTNLDDLQIVVPNSLQMGWCESPSLFCSGTETARDTINELLHDMILQPHQMEQIMLQEITPTPTQEPATTPTPAPTAIPTMPLLPPPATTIPIHH
jgi:hypothetical protein